MDLNYILLWLLGISCTSILIRSLRGNRLEHMGWLIVSALILLLTAVCMFIRFDIAGLLGGVFWGLFILLPSFGYTAAKKALEAGNYAKASKIIKLFFPLHPFADWRQVLIVFEQKRCEERNHATTDSSVPNSEASTDLLGQGMIGKWRPYFCYCLIGFIALVFFVEIFLGVRQQPLVLVVMGALLPVAVLEYGEWWRLITALFLHWGWLHVIMNLLALYIIAPSLENHFGWLRFGIIYFCSGFLSLLYVVILANYGLVPANGMWVGASGAIMGLVGAMAAFFLYYWLKNRDRSAFQGLKRVLLVVVLQTTFDLSTEQVSFSAHFGGLVSGFVMTLLYLLGSTHLRAR